MPGARPYMGVFGLYVGLIASGYDLVRPGPGEPMEPIVRSIRTSQWPHQAMEYFAMARRPGKGVNPFWPRAAMLLEASFYMGGSGELRHPDRLMLLRAIDAFPVAGQEKGPATADWVMGFPDSYRLLVETDLFPLLWSSYLEALAPKLPGFGDIVQSAFESLSAKTGIPAQDLPDLVVVPNLLQAPQVADFVRKDGCIYVVVADPRPSSIIHELLHDVVSPVLRAGRGEIIGHRHLLRPVLRPMMRMQYAWDDDDESWLRVFEENFMRAAAIWIERGGEKGEGDREAAFHARQGFIYVPAILECLRETRGGLRAATDLIRRCLGEMVSGSSGGL